MTTILASHENLLNPLLQFLLALGDDIAKRSGEKNLITHQKSSVGDLVTALDLEVQGRLEEFLVNLIPGSSFVGEGTRNNSEGGEALWVVDPIDGTTNIVHGLPYSAISVALLLDGKVTLGVVHNIFECSTSFAVLEGGAHEVSAEGTQTTLQVSQVPSLSKALVSFGLPYDRSNAARVFRAAEKVFEVSQDLRRQGSAALDLVSVAAGRLDAHFELDLRMWDVAAAGLILTEAGGLLTDWESKPLQFGDPTARIPTIASNSLVHSELQLILTEGLAI